MNGWKCPECGRVFAPHVDECKYCGNNTITIRPEPAPYVPSPTVPTTIPHPHPYPYTQPFIWRQPDDWWRNPIVTWTTSTTSTSAPNTRYTVLS